MSISFSGVGSGLDTSSWITALLQDSQDRVNNLVNKQSSIQTSKSTLNTVEGKFSSLRSLVEKFTDANLASSFDIFAKKLATSSDSSIATVTASTSATNQAIDLKVESLATATVAKSINNIGQFATKDGTTIAELADGGITEGDFSLYVNGAKRTISVAGTDKIQDVINQINAQGDLTADYNESTGKFSISYDNTAVTSFGMGSNNDKSNFLNAMQLSSSVSSTVGTTTKYESANAITTFNYGSALVNSDGTHPANTSTGVTAGKFIIGGETFEITANDTSLSSLIYKINNSDNAGVTASFDSRSGKLKLTSNDPGQVAINLEEVDGGSNFLRAVGLIDPDTGSVTSSQTLGNNAKVYLNGSDEAIYANSNTLSSDITGLTGITINLLNTTADTDSNNVHITVNQDTASLSDSVSNFVSKFNDIIKEVNNNTSRSGSLSSEYRLVSMTSNLKSTLSDRVSGLTNYDSLSMIGISTGSVGASINDDTKTIQFDKDKFIAALQDNPDEVKALFIGDSTKGITGIFQQLEDKLDSQLDPINGYFASRENSMDSSISSLDKSIARAQERFDSEKTRLTKQFNAMDQMISSLQQQQTYLSSI